MMLEKESGSHPNHFRQIMRPILQSRHIVLHLEVLWVGHGALAESKELVLPYSPHYLVEPPQSTNIGAVELHISKAVSSFAVLAKCVLAGYLKRWFWRSKDIDNKVDQHSTVDNQRYQTLPAKPGKIFIIGFFGSSWFPKS